MGFEVVSDMPSDALKELLHDLIRFEQFAEPYLPGSPTQTQAPMTMLIFSSHQKFQRYFGTGRVAGFMQPSLTTSTLVIAPHRGNRRLQETARHEYAHYLLRNRLDVSLPVWFDEGLAQLLSNIEVDGETVAIGALPSQRMQSLYSADNLRSLNIRQMLNADDLSAWSASRMNQFYAYAWLLTHYLLFDSEERTTQLQQFLLEREGPLADYLGYSNASLERRLKRYSDRRAIVRQEHYPAAPPLALSPQCLSAEDRDLTIAAALIDHSPINARELLDPYLQAAPDDSRILVLASRAEAALGEEARSLALAERALAATPDDATVLTNYGNRMTDGCLLRRSDECREIWRDALPYYQQALSIDLGRFDAVFGVGLAYLHSGRPGEAVNYLKVVYSRAPWAVPVNFYLGDSYRIIGDSRAELYLRNASHWSQHALWRALATMALDELSG